jgi:hypothetical protein
VWRKDHGAQLGNQDNSVRAQTYGGEAREKAQTVLYLTGGVDLYEDLLTQLGQHKTGKGCLYLKRVDQADPEILRDIIDRAYRTATQTDAS